MDNAKGWVICLCDYTGHFAEPWIQFGYRALLVDPQHKDFTIECDGLLWKFPGTIEDVLPFLSFLVLSGKVSFVMGFPPCTDVAVSGARWWEEKRKADPYFQAKATRIAEQCRTIGEMCGCPWAFENPVSAFSSIFGEPSYTFDPCDFSELCIEDQYFKKTCLWTGGGFTMPPPYPKGVLGKPDDRIFRAPPSEDRANFRSATPKGFARAVFLHNCPDFKST